MKTTPFPIEVLKVRILRAIKNGNHETKYILEACNEIRAWANFGEALDQLKREGVIKYNELLEGYYLAQFQWRENPPNVSLLNYGGLIMKEFIKI